MIFHSTLKLKLFSNNNTTHKNIQVYNKTSQVDTLIVNHPLTHTHQHLKTHHHKADLINWPTGLRPKKGNISKSALLKLKVIFNLNTFIQWYKY